MCATKQKLSLVDINIHHLQIMLVSVVENFLKNSIGSLSQKRAKSSLVQSEYDVIECGDSDNSENVDENKDEDASDDDSTTNRHGNEPKVRIGAKDFVRAKCGAVAVPRKKAKKSRKGANDLLEQQVPLPPSESCVVQSGASTPYVSTLSGKTLQEMANKLEEAEDDSMTSNLVLISFAISCKVLPLGVETSTTLHHTTFTRR